MRFYFNEQDKDLLNEEVTPLETAEYLGLGIKKWEHVIPSFARIQTTTTGIMGHA